jgi:hypothetical protein
MTGPGTVEILADIAQVIIGLAAVVSIWIGVATLRETRRERRERVRPRLAFDHGGQVVRCNDLQSVGVPGMNPAYIVGLVGPAKRPVRRPKERWGKLRNHGGGVALDVRVTFIAQEAQIGDETFQIDLAKLKTFPYQLDLNRLPASPTHIPPGEEAFFGRIPTPMYEREGNRQVIKGVAVITCSDVLERGHVRFQKFRCAVSAEPGLYGVTMTFSDELTKEEAREELGESSAAVAGLPTPRDLRSRLPVLTGH